MTFISGAGIAVNHQNKAGEGVMTAQTDEWLRRVHWQAAVTQCW